MRDESSKYKTFTRRALIIGGVKMLFFLGVVGRYYNLQMMTSSRFAMLSDKNRLKVLVLPPPRGVILDSNREVIATNSSNFRIGIDSLAVGNVMEITKMISAILGKDMAFSEDELRRKIAKKQAQDYLFLKDNLQWDEISKLLEYDHMLDGVEVIESSHRAYVHSEAFAHITGYVSAPNKEEVERMSLSTSEQIKVGKIGVERVFDKPLRGVPGLKRNEVDVKGALVRTIDVTLPTPGDELQLTIDARLQNFIHNLLISNELVASVIVLDVQNGKVLALHSTPTFDPNMFVDGISKENWDRITHADNNPLLNHAVTSAYPPGSTFKVVTAFAGLLNGVDPNMKHTCHGQFNLGSRIFRCHKLTGHGSIDLPTAIAQSCNPYFFNLALKIGIEKLHHAAAMLGLGERTGIELFGEVAGLMPSPKWKEKRFKLKWYPGDTVNTSIGQGYTLLTPLQIAVMTARIASGKRISPTLLASTNADIPPLDVDPKVLDIIRLGMHDCVNSPKGILYARQLSANNFRICGKTGTAQVVALKHKNLGHNFKHHGLFTSFAPYENPRYSVTVVVEHGEAGSKVTPIAREIYAMLKRLSEES